MQYERATERRLEEALGETGGQHKERLIRSLQESLGEFERAASLNPVLLEEADCGGYIRQRVELTVVPGLSFGAYVLVPKGSSGKLPGVIALHGHGYGSRQICGLNEDGTADSGPPDGYHHFAVQLAGKGMIVIAPDVIGFGERRMQ
ncbi:dienelactone hydrolase, partial [Paenibacillus sepulcri]|nr:dienelactone hydrolase [Paenibacillus sepulcri]